MKCFNSEIPSDMITLEMRIKEDIRHVLKAIISSEDKKKILEEALESAISTGNIVSVIESHVHQAINDAVKEYFSYGEDGLIFKKAIHDVLHEIMPKLLLKMYIKDQIGFR
jgi:hypothetical protein